MKSQILAGGRGLGHFTNGLKGGVHIVKATDAPALAEKMLGGTLVGSLCTLETPARLLLRLLTLSKSRESAVLDTVPFSWLHSPRQSLYQVLPRDAVAEFIARRLAQTSGQSWHVSRAPVPLRLSSAASSPALPCVRR